MTASYVIKLMRQFAWDAAENASKLNIDSWSYIYLHTRANTWADAADLLEESVIRSVTELDVTMPNCCNPLGHKDL